MIPKVIHYVWFGRGKKSNLIKSCIKSWSKIMPDYEVIEWNEDNFDINMNQYCKQAYDKKKYAFCADYARLWILYTCGGIYMDTDVKVFKKLDPFLNHNGFTCFENSNQVAFVTVGCEKGNPIIKLLLDSYENRSLLDDSQPSGIDWTANVQALTPLLTAKGLILNNQYQEIEGFSIYPSYYFCAPGEGETNYATHYFTSTWLPKSIQRKNHYHRRIGYIKKAVKKLMGNKLYEKLKSTFHRK